MDVAEVVGSSAASTTDASLAGIKPQVGNASSSNRNQQEAEEESCEGTHGLEENKIDDLGSPGF